MRASSQRRETAMTNPIQLPRYSRHQALLAIRSSCAALRAGISSGFGGGGNGFSGAGLNSGGHFFQHNSPNFRLCPSSVSMEINPNGESTQWPGTRYDFWCRLIWPDLSLTPFITAWREYRPAILSTHLRYGRALHLPIGRRPLRLSEGEEDDW